MNKIFSGLIFCAMLSLFINSCGKKTTTSWRTTTIERGDIKVEVTATGTINPHALVAVGTQVSGTIQKIYVDFNSKVHAGQLIALLDTTFLHAALEDARASLQRTQSQENLTKRNMERSTELFNKGLAAQADLDQATADYAAASASRTSAQAVVERAKINITYASIKSPITGVVVNRAVDVGQTVAASFNTPTLFSIADDLSKMQVQASIDEADIGQIKTGQMTVFSVDAYPNRTFSGVVTQIRLQPTIVQNVVSYTVMIDVENPDLVLMPGMTANIAIEVNSAKNVLKVPASALKFIPPREKRGSNNLRKRQSGNALPGSTSPRDTSKTGRSWQQGKHSTGGPTNAQATESTRGALYLLINDTPTRVRVTTGLTNGGFTAVIGDLKEGQTVIVGLQNNGSKPSPTQSSPLGGMPRRLH